MPHYICTGECGGVSDHPTTCHAEKCSMYGKPFVECNCGDPKSHEKMDKEDKPKE